MRRIGSLVDMAWIIHVCLASDSAAMLVRGGNGGREGGGFILDIQSPCPATDNQVICTLIIRLLRHSCSHRVIFPDVVGCRCSNFFFQILSLLSWSNWEPKRGHARRGKRGRRGGRRGEKLQSHSHKMMRNLEENKTETGANKMMMDESSPLATLGEHIAKLSSLGKANGYGKCKDRLQKYLCPARGVGCIPYLTVPYLTYTFYEDGRGRTISFPDATRHTSRLQPRLLRLAHSGPTTYLFFIQFQYPHSNILKPKKSTCQTVITPTSFHPRVGIITIYTNPVESDHANVHISHISQFFLHACDGVCNSLSETISIYFFPDLPSDLSPSPDER